MHHINRESKEIPEKKSTSASLTILKILIVSITTNCGIFLRDGNTIPLHVSSETCMGVKKQQLELEIEKLVQIWERSMTRLYTVTLLI